MSRPRTGFPYLDEPGVVIAFAHRGGAKHPDIAGLENTWVAFEHAVALGYRYVETDVHATTDGVLLAFHDATLDRLTDLEGVIYEQPYVDLRAALIAGEYPIPRLDELFDHFADVRFNIDIKSRGAIEPLATLIERCNAHDRVCVGSFNESVIRAFRRRLSRPVATACSRLAVVATMCGAPPRGLPRDTGAVFQVPPRHRSVTVLTPAFVRRAHRSGRHVHAWTIDDPAEMHRLLDLGVDGIFTDRTDLLRDVLIERGQWMGRTA